MTAFSAFRPLELSLPPHVLAETLDGGQTFRWHQGTDGAWEGRWAGHTARLRLDAEHRIEWSGPAAEAAATLPALRRFLALDRDLAAAADQLPWRSDAHLAQAMAAFPGLRLLRQPFGETLLCFLCSSAKQIVQIKQIAAALAIRRGRLPTWSELAETPEAALRAAKLGFRARYVRQTAQFLAAHPGWLEETEGLPYPEAKDRLRTLPGVGEKVADCCLLFGAGRWEAFPVDIWILHAMSRRYGLHGWKPAQVAHFGRTHFGAHAGLAQQYLFAWERKYG